MSNHPRAYATSGWVPAVLLATATAFVVSYFGVPLIQVAGFTAYAVLGLAVPGMLWVRLLRRRAAHLAEDVALGLALGYCVELTTYLGARAVGAPRLFLIWPVITLIAFTVVPGLRRHWRGSGERVSAGWSWALTAILGFLLLHAAGTFFRQHHLTGSDTPFIDMPYHLSLIGELKHHVPPAVPYVTGEPLAYHWFFYAETAATSWATGIEPLTLLYRLSLLPMFAALVVLIAVTARRLTGAAWSGPVAAGIAMLGTVASPHGWVLRPVSDTLPVNSTWLSPTNLFGMTLLAATVLILVELLDPDRRAPRTQWVLLALLIAGVSGAKASLLPLLIVGATFAVIVVAIAQRRLHLPAAIIAALSIVGLAFASTVIFHGTSGGLAVGPRALLDLPISRALGTATVTAMPWPALGAVLIMVAIALWSLLWAGTLGVAIRHIRTGEDARILLLVGICLAALGAVVVLRYPGASQGYFLVGAAGVFGVITAAGIKALLPQQPRSRVLAVAVAIAALVGAASAEAIAAIGPNTKPSLRPEDLPGAVAAIVLPVAALLAVLAVGVFAVRRAQRRLPGLAGAAGLLVVALAMGFSAPSVARRIPEPLLTGPTAGARISNDGITAARWLRANSDPGTLVATNLHCQALMDSVDTCAARHFWVSGFSERRVLVEGWAYTASANAAVKSGTSDRLERYWDVALLRANDAAFTTPSTASLDELRDRYGVQWLFADLRLADENGLGSQADLRFRSGSYAVYHLR